MVYRRMNIGTAKPSPAVLARHPHALVDIVDPVDAYSAARFVADADAAVRASLAAGRVPVLVGGTMLYFRAFRDGIGEMPPANAEVRRAIADRARRERLASVAPRAGRARPRCRGSHRPAQQPTYSTGAGGRSTHRTIHHRALGAAGAAPATARLGCDVAEIAILPDHRAALHARIAQRLDAMLNRGLVDEVRALRDDPMLHVDLPSMRAVGYRQVWRPSGRRLRPRGNGESRRGRHAPSRQTAVDLAAALGRRCGRRRRIGGRASLAKDRTRTHSSVALNRCGVHASGTRTGSRRSRVATGLGRFDQ